MSGPDEKKAIPEPTSLRLMGTLGIAGLIAGMLLVGVYEGTLPIIEENDRIALREAVKTVVPGSTRMQKLVRGPDGLAPASETDKAPGVFAAYDEEGGFRGYAIAGEGAGFQDVIKLIYGFDPRTNTLTGMFVLESRETPGLGDKIYKDMAFVRAFEGLSPVPEIVPVKPGATSAANEIDTITGATISAKAVVKIINTAHRSWVEALPPNPPGLPAVAQEGGQ
jgi:Na+-translocating ferredoxin:NAD+ oxidoreductase subunit G